MAGGLEPALHCDFTVAANDAQFRFLNQQSRFHRSVAGCNGWQSAPVADGLH
jgi:hypothetical protein